MQLIILCIVGVHLSLISASITICLHMEVTDVSSVVRETDSHSNNYKHAHTQQADNTYNTLYTPTQKSYLHYTLETTFTKPSITQSFCPIISFLPPVSSCCFPLWSCDEVEQHLACPAVYKCLLRLLLNYNCQTPCFFTVMQTSHSNYSSVTCITVNLWLRCLVILGMCQLSPCWLPARPEFSVTNGKKTTVPQKHCFLHEIIAPEDS